MTSIEKLKKLIEEGEKVLATKHRNSIGYEVVKRDDFFKWYTQVLLYLKEKCPEDIILKQIEGMDYHYYRHAEKVLGVLKGLTEYLKAK